MRLRNRFGSWKFFGGDRGLQPTPVTTATWAALNGAKSICFGLLQRGLRDTIILIFDLAEDLDFCQHRISILLFKSEHECSWSKWSCFCVQAKHNLILLNQLEASKRLPLLRLKIHKRNNLHYCNVYLEILVPLSNSLGESIISYFFRRFFLCLRVCLLLQEAFSFFFRCPFPVGNLLLF